MVYLCALPFILFAGLGVIILFLANSYLLGREYFELAAMRFRPPHEAKAMRKSKAVYVFLAGMFVAVFVSIPVVNLATPIFAMAFMVHVHKKLSGSRPQLIEPLADRQFFERRSITRLALPTERSTVPGFTVRTVAVTPINSLMW